MKKQLACGSRLTHTPAAQRLSGFPLPSLSTAKEKISHFSVLSVPLW